MSRKQVIEKIFNSVISSKQVHEAVLLVEDAKGDFSVNYGYGGKDINSPLFMASVTKLFTTTCILILQEQDKLSLDDTLDVYFDDTILKGLHVFKGVDYSKSITIADLLFQTSGLPDLFEEGEAKKVAIEKDYSIDFKEKLVRTKVLEPHFAPHTSKRAYYSDINFDILGKIIEQVSQKTLAEAYRIYIFNILDLEKTYLPTSKDYLAPSIYYKNEVLYRPKFIVSCGASGGCITTGEELMRFLKAFFNGTFFEKDILKRLSVYKKLQMSMGPIYYGGGYMQIPLNTISTLFRGKGDLMGHSGTTGSFAFYFPHKDLYFVGNLNQMAAPALPIRLVMKLGMLLK